MDELEERTTSDPVSENPTAGSSRRDFLGHGVAAVTAAAALAAAASPLRQLDPSDIPSLEEF